MSEYSYLIESSMLKALAENDIIKQEFFVDVDNIVIFDKHKFKEFVSDKRFLVRE